MKYLKYILLSLIASVMHIGLAEARYFTDNEIKEEIIRYIAPKCSRSGNDIKLVDTDCINGDTNRMLRLLSDLIATNDEWICTLSMWQYGKYATKSELPFLYSCVTNRMCGDRALNTIIFLEGVCSNSLFAVGEYLSITNGFSVDNDSKRSRFAESFLRKVYQTESMMSYRKQVFNIIQDFALRVNLMHVSVDKALMDADASYRNSKRRLNVMRGARERCISEFLTNYVTNVIKTLEAYPESDLPD
jgi:hypothetical protein